MLFNRIEIFIILTSQDLQNGKIQKSQNGMSRASKIEKFNPLTASTEPHTPNFEGLKKLNEFRKKNVLNEIYVYIPPDRSKNEKVPEYTEQDFKKIKVSDFYKVAVKPNNTLKMSDLSSPKLKKIQFLHSLSKDKPEFEYIFSTFWEKVDTNEMDLETFGIYVLSLREIFAITKQNEHNILNIKSLQQLEATYANSYNYLRLSRTENVWHNWILQYNQKFTIPPVELKNVFSNEEIKKLIRVHYPNNEAFYDKMVQWIKIRNTFFKVIDTMVVYSANKDLFNSYDIDFNTFKINTELDKFEKQISDINIYKILNKLLQRLDSEKRQSVRNHKYLFTDYFNLCQKLYAAQKPFDRFEPVLKKMPQYQNASDLYIGLNNIIDEHNLYSIYEDAKKTSGVKIVHYDEVRQKIMLKITSYSAMKKFGSPIWCIVYQKSSYMSYKIVLFRSFYIYIDAKDIQRDNEPFMIGYTVNLFKQVVYANDRFNHDVVGSRATKIFKNCLKIAKNRR